MADEVGRPTSTAVRCARETPDLKTAAHCAAAGLSCDGTSSHLTSTGRHSASSSRIPFSVAMSGAEMCRDSPS